MVFVLRKWSGRCRYNNECSSLRITPNPARRATQAAIITQGGLRPWQDSQNLALLFLGRLLVVGALFDDEVSFDLQQRHDGIAIGARNFDVGIVAQALQIILVRLR